ncbi:MAG: methionyl-tRNA formyltransferase [Mariprofundaceae bacterium]|nr:methionyl-tRNA formyltransferase [Mariprofundaceae bacterium]
MRIVFAGTPGFSIPCLEALLTDDYFEVVGVLSQPDRRSGRGMKLTPSPVKQRALDVGLDVLTPERLRENSEALNWLLDKQADVLVVVAFGMILPCEWLAAPRIAPVNVHASLLPRWRGAAPIERAFLAGDSETGVCIMHMQQGLDTGGVYASRRVPISASLTGAQLWSSLSTSGAELLIETLPDIASGALPAVAQDDALATYAAKLDNRERMIDWTASAAQVDRQVRCFSPRPGARTRLDGKWLKLLSGEICSEKTACVPGSIVGDDFRVACGDGLLYQVLNVQAEGKKAMDAASFLRGQSLKAGEVLGADD